MLPRTVELLEFIDSNPYLPITSIIEEFFGADIVLVLKTEKNKEDILEILREAGIEDVL